MESYQPKVTAEAGCATPPEGTDPRRVLVRIDRIDYNPEDENVAPPHYFEPTLERLRWDSTREPDVHAHLTRVIPAYIMERTGHRIWSCTYRFIF